LGHDFELLPLLTRFDVLHEISMGLHKLLTDFTLLAERGGQNIDLLSLTCRTQFSSARGGFVFEEQRKCVF